MSSASFSSNPGGLIAGVDDTVVSPRNPLNADGLATPNAFFDDSAVDEPKPQPDEVEDALDEKAPKPLAVGFASPEAAKEPKPPVAGLLLANGEVELAAEEPNGLG